MTTFFIADLHLDPTLPDLTNRFVNFLKNRAPEGEALYILGDLFNAWLGDDYKTPFTQIITQSLRDLAQRGIPVYLMKGNRDFLLGNRFAKACHAQLLPEIHKILLYGVPTVLCHGDHLCTADTRHQRFRTISRLKSVQWLINHTPLSWRKKVAAKLRQLSGKHITNEAWLDVSEKAVTQLLAQEKTKQLIHGHTHRPYIHALSDQPFHRRIVLSDWHNDRGNALRYTADGEAELIYF